MDTVETVKVCNPADPGGYMIINKADLTDEHQLFGVEPEAKASGKRAAKADPEPQAPADAQ